MNIQNTHTARDFVLQLGSLITLFVSLSALIALIFGIINLAFPDKIEGYWAVESANDSIRFGIAALIVFFPVYLVLTRYVNKVRRAETHGAYLTLTRWLIYLSLLIGGAILLGDLVTVILTFLNGEITARFALKAFTMFIVVGIGFLYYVLDAKGYWQKRERGSIIYGAGVLAVVIVAIVFGFFYAGSPQDAREIRLDQRQINDLQDIQWRVEEYFNLNDELPQDIDILFSGIIAPSAPEGISDYEYAVLEENRFELCATFSSESVTLTRARPVPVALFEVQLIRDPNNWDHGVGRVCFERIVQTDVFKSVGGFQLSPAVKSTE